MLLVTFRIMRLLSSTFKGNALRGKSAAVKKMLQRAEVACSLLTIPKQERPNSECLELLFSVS